MHRTHAAHVLHTAHTNREFYDYVAGVCATRGALYYGVRYPLARAARHTARAGAVVPNFFTSGSAGLHYIGSSKE